MAKRKVKNDSAIDISKLEAEKRSLLILKNNPDRLKEIIDKLDFLYYGIIN